jgi:hypothetical protein
MSWHVFDDQDERCIRAKVFIARAFGDLFVEIAGFKQAAFCNEKLSAGIAKEFSDIVRLPAVRAASL